MRKLDKEALSKVVVLVLTGEGFKVVDRVVIETTLLKS